MNIKVTDLFSEHELSILSPEQLTLIEEDLVRTNDICIEYEIYKTPDSIDDTKIYFPFLNKKAEQERNKPFYAKVFNKKKRTK